MSFTPRDPATPFAVLDSICSDIPLDVAVVDAGKLGPDVQMCVVYHWHVYQWHPRGTVVGGWKTIRLWLLLHSNLYFAIIKLVFLNVLLISPGSR